MPLTITHTFPSAKADSGDPTIVRPVNWNDNHQITGGGLMLAGTVIDFAGAAWPSYMLECYGQSVPAATYPLLFAAMVRQAPVTFTMGSPGTVNWTGHGIPVYGKVRLKTSGFLPNGPTIDVDYFVTATGYSANTFQLSATVGGAALAFSTGSMAGTHTAYHAPYGVSTDLSTFTIPDLRGRVVAGLDLMGGASANRMTGLFGSVNGAVLGNSGGSATHLMALSELPLHTHGSGTLAGTTAITVDSGGAHTHTVSGTISTAPDHTHSGSGGTIGDGGGHSHAITGSTGNDTPDHAHLQTGRMYGASYAGPAGTHAHTIPIEYHNTFQAGTGSRMVFQPFEQVGSTGNAYVTSDSAGAHDHYVYVDLAGYTAGASTRHTHGTGTLAAQGVAHHTHPLSGLTIANGGAHSHTFDSGVAQSGGAHTHTASGVVTLTGTTGSAGSNTEHNNMQPTFVLRKLIFVG